MRVGRKVGGVIGLLLAIHLVIYFRHSGSGLTAHIYHEPAIDVDSTEPVSSSQLSSERVEDAADEEAEDLPDEEAEDLPDEEAEDLPDEEYSELVEKTTYLKPLSKLNIVNAPVLSSPDIPRALNRSMYDTYINLLDELSQMFFAHNISFCMISGTLIGSYVAHDILPWDDDMDFMIRYSDLPKVKKLFKNATIWERINLHTFAERRNAGLDHNEYNLEYLQSFPDNSTDEEYYNWHYKTPNHNTTRHKFKAYYKHSLKSRFDWNWPFIDFIYYGENDTHVWKMWGKVPMAVPKFTFLPLQRRPLGRLWIPGPRDTNVFLKREYKQFLCRSHYWSHIFQHGQRTKTVTCLDVLGHYPFVWREAVVDGTLEMLMLNDTIIQSVVMPYTLSSIPPFGIEQLSASMGKRLKN